MANHTTVLAEITFIPASEGGRVQMPDFAVGGYAPHLVVQSPDVRQAIIVNDYAVEQYLPVRFKASQAEYRAGHAGQFTLELIYSPDPLYAPLRPGATFTVREGHRIIGYGTILERTITATD
jgi:translation elongation factor EF-Tu-like GTPase